MKNRYKYLVLFIFLFGLFLSIKLIESNVFNFFNTESTSTNNNSNSYNGSSSYLTSNIVGNTIVVEISGAVINPGVYTLNNDSRVEDLIDLAGGIDNAKADLNLIGQNINKAQKLKDQQKVYIPFLITNTSNSQLNGSKTTQNTQNYLISINSASYQELLSLNGVGDVTANKIISNRYYSTTDELVSKKVISSSLYQKIKDLISI